MKHQNGLSLYSMLFFCIIVILIMTYGKGIAAIQYNKYKVGQIMSAVLKNNTDNRDLTLRKMFDDRVQFEKVSYANSSLLRINKDSGIELSIQYQHCEDIFSSWYVCNDVSISKK